MNAVSLIFIVPVILAPRLDKLKDELTEFFQALCANPGRYEGQAILLDPPHLPPMPRLLDFDHLLNELVSALVLQAGVAVLNRGLNRC